MINFSEIGDSAKLDSLILVCISVFKAPGLIAIEKILFDQSFVSSAIQAVNIFSAALDVNSTSDFAGNVLTAHLVALAPGLGGAVLLVVAKALGLEVAEQLHVDAVPRLRLELPVLHLEERVADHHFRRRAVIEVIEVPAQRDLGFRSIRPSGPFGTLLHGRAR